VLSAVKLDGQPMLDRSEVGNEWTDRHLASKLHAIEATIAQQSPHDAFGVCCISAKCASRISLLAFAHRWPSPGRDAATLSRKREREENNLN
jgi:hypothetical protein